MMSPYGSRGIYTLGKRVTDQVARAMRSSLENIAILSCHGDQVIRLPQDATLFGSSKRCVNEVWGIGTHVLCF